MSDAAETPFIDRRQSPRARLALPCRLHRRTSSPIWAETIDVGVGGMSIRAARPLQSDELVEFDLAGSRDAHVTGSARVTRLTGPRVYALRFESLAAPMRERLEQLVRRG